jgi:hypothetical protein
MFALNNWLPTLVQWNINKWKGKGWSPKNVEGQPQNKGRTCFWGLSLSPTHTHTRMGAHKYSTSHLQMHKTCMLLGQTQTSRLTRGWVTVRLPLIPHEDLMNKDNACFENNCYMKVTCKICNPFPRLFFLQNITTLIIHTTLIQPSSIKHKNLVYQWNIGTRNK